MGRVASDTPLEWESAWPWPGGVAERAGRVGYAHGVGVRIQGDPQGPGPVRRTLSCIIRR